MRVLGVGIATLDIISEVTAWPVEDSEVRAVAHRRSVGGNVCNSLRVLVQQGHDCEFAGTLADCADSALIRAELQQDRVGLDYAVTHRNCKVPVSQVTINRENGTRTIVHYRDLPELEFTDFPLRELENFDWIHFEGRNIPAVEAMLRAIKSSDFGGIVSLEVEKVRPAIESLMPFADIVMFSRQYAQQTGFSGGDEFLRDMRNRLPARYISCAWGSQGAYLCGNNAISFQAAFEPPRLIDTLAAGDVFNAGLIHALGVGQDGPAALVYACRLAGRKCGQAGLDGLFV